MDIAQIPTGVVKTFGEYGIPYQVGELAENLPDGDMLINITLIQTGEQSQYKLSKLLQDPNAE